MRLDQSEYPTSEDHLIVGKVKKAHGVHGEIFIHLFSGEAAWLEKLETVSLVKAVGKDFTFETYTIKRKRLHKEGLILHLNEVKDRNKAEELKGAMFEVPESFFISEPGEEIYLREVLNFTVEKNGEIVGKIVRFSTNGLQDLVILETEKGSFEIPFVDDFIEEILPEEKKVKMRFPDGLLGEE